MLRVDWYLICYLELGGIMILCQLITCDWTVFTWNTWNKQQKWAIHLLGITEHHMIHYMLCSRWFYGYGEPPDHAVKTLAFDDNWCKNSSWNWTNQKSLLIMSGFLVWEGSSHPLVTPTQLMRPGISSCALGDIAYHLGLPLQGDVVHWW